MFERRTENVLVSPPDKNWTHELLTNTVCSLDLIVQCRVVSREVLAGTAIGGGGGGGRLYLTLHCHHQNDSCVKMGSGGSHFNVSFIVEEQSHLRKCGSVWRSDKALGCAVSERHGFDRWCDDLGFVPANSVSGSSTLQIFETQATCDGCFAC